MTIVERGGENSRETLSAGDGARERKEKIKMKK
jgi:hypothetical protein